MIEVRTQAGELLGAVQGNISGDSPPPYLAFRLSFPPDLMAPKPGRPRPLPASADPAAIKLSVVQFRRIPADRLTKQINGMATQPELRYGLSSGGFPIETLRRIPGWVDAKA